jgi:hypothetical protein
MIMKLSYEIGLSKFINTQAFISEYKCSDLYKVNLIIVEYINK